MNLLQYFEETTEDGSVRFTLNEEERQEFLDSLPNDFSLNYISKSELQKKALANEMSERDFFEQFKIPEIPAYANVRSGDFGEMMCFILVKNRGHKNGLRLAGPRKWRWKADKNKPCHGSDVVLFHRHEHKPSDKDCIEAVESKMKATASNSTPIKNAIIGAVDDKVKRLAKTLNWTHERLAIDGKPRLREAINRYRFMDVNPTYQKKFHAIAIIDDEFVRDEIAKDRNIDDVDIEVTIVSMKSLKNAYENFYEELLNSLK
mgnify:CR=1 FL=1